VLCGSAQELSHLPTYHSCSPGFSTNGQGGSETPQTDADNSQNKIHDKFLLCRPQSSASFPRLFGGVSQRGGFKNTIQKKLLKEIMPGAFTKN
jgi:hypothetical protein